MSSCAMRQVLDCGISVTMARRTFLSYSRGKPLASPLKKHGSACSVPGRRWRATRSSRFAETIFLDEKPAARGQQPVDDEPFPNLVPRHIAGVLDQHIPPQDATTPPHKPS